MTPSAAAVTIRPVEPDDLDACRAIERAVYPNPWRPEHFDDLLALDPGVALAAVDDGRVVGYAMGWVVADEAELANLAVDEGSRRRGIGSRLLEAFAGESVRRGADRLWLEVRASNEAARALYARHGFEVVGRRRGYYDRPREDALVLTADPVAIG